MNTNTSKLIWFIFVTVTTLFMVEHSENYWWLLLFALLALEQYFNHNQNS
jgi:hypothetical protein